MPQYFLKVRKQGFTFTENQGFPVQVQMTDLQYKKCFNPVYFTLKRVDEIGL